VFALTPSPGFNDGYANWNIVEGAFTDKGDVTCMAIYQGNLYAGHSNLAASPAYAKINVFPLPGGTTVASGASVSLTATGSGAASGNGFVSMAIFQGKLYASFLNFGVESLVYKFDGTTWTQAFTITLGTKAPLNLHVDSDGDILYAFGTTSAVATPAWYTTPDGVTWTSKATNMNAGGGGKFPQNIFADFNQ
jgi:hypothetical protein